MLAAIGLSPAESALYAALVTKPSARGEELAAQLGISITDCRDLLGELVLRGIVRHAMSDPEAFVAVAPEVALRGSLISRQAELHRAEAQIALLAQQYQRGVAGRVSTDAVDVVTGWDEIERHGRQINDAAQEQIRTLLRNPSLRGSPDLGRSHRAAAERGVRNRMIYEGEGLDPSELRRSLNHFDKTGTDIRIASTVPARVLIADERIALVGLDPEPTEQVQTALIVHPGGLLMALLGLFDALWPVAVPVTQDAPATSGLSEVETRILNLLVAGFTDRAIAGMLKSSERSVQRHVRRMMDEANAQSRVQLGWQAAKAGWLTAP